MGITYSMSSSGLNNINLFGISKVGDEEVQALAGIFGNINLNGAPFVKGIFAETNIKGNAINVTYATDSHESCNVQESLRLRVINHELLDIDLNFFHNISISNSLKAFRFGGNICWSFPEGHLMAIGASHSPSLNNTTLDWINKLNLYKSESKAFHIDIISNLTVFLRGPFAGTHNVVISLAISYDMLHSHRNKTNIVTN